MPGGLKSIVACVSLPSEHRENLRELGEAHEQRIHALRSVIHAAQQELAIHEVLLGLVHNEPLIAALGNLHVDSDHRAKAARDPVRYCAEHGISLPPEMTVQSVEANGQSMRISAIVRVGDCEIEVVWDREAGVNARPLRGYRRDLAQIVNLII